MTAIRISLALILICVGTTMVALAQTGSTPEPDCTLNVKSVTAKDEAQNVGNRSSKDELEVVTGGEEGSASIAFTAETEGDAGDEAPQPTWTGFDGSDSYDGSTSAHYEGEDSVTATASGCKGSASVKVTTKEKDDQTKSTKVEEIFPGIADKTKDFQGFQATFKATADFEKYHTWNAPTYDKPMVGICAEINGTAKADLSGSYSEQKSFDLPLNLGTVTAAASFELGLNLSFVASNFKSDVSKKPRESGSMKVEAGGNVKISLSGTFPIHNFGVDHASVSGEASVGPTCSGDLDGTEGVFHLQLGLKEAHLAPKATIYYDNGDTKEYGFDVKVDELSGAELDISINVKDWPHND